MCLMENNQKNNNKGRKNFIIYRSVYQGKMGEKLEKEKKYLSSVCIWEGVCQCVIIAFTNRPYIFESKAHIQEEMWWVTSIYVCLSLRSHSHNTIHLCVCMSNKFPFFFVENRRKLLIFVSRKKQQRFVSSILNQICVAVVTNITNRNNRRILTNNVFGWVKAISFFAILPDKIALIKRNRWQWMMMNEWMNHVRVTVPNQKNMTMKRTIDREVARKKSESFFFFSPISNILNIGTRVWLGSMFSVPGKKNQ